MSEAANDPPRRRIFDPRTNLPTSVNTVRANTSYAGFKKSLD